MEQSEFICRFHGNPVFAILRGLSPRETESVCSVLIANGIRIIEIPLNRPGALECVRIASAFCGDGQCVGAGTVLTCDQVDQVRRNGGTFVVSPNMDISVIKRTKEAGMISVPGFLTPSEAFAAIHAGADSLKLFPAAPFGIPYVKQIKPFISVPLFAVGGIGMDNLESFLPVCDGVGIGSALYTPGKTAEQISKSAAEIMGIVRNHQKQNKKE